MPKPRRCPVCRLGRFLIWHGQYWRNLITLDAVHLIPIKRLYCKLCRHTFGLIPSFVAKFHRYAKEVILDAVRRLKFQTYEAVADRFMARGRLYVATLTLYFWRRKFA